MNIARPQPIEAQPPQVPAHAQPAPSPSALIATHEAGQWWYTLLRKVSYHLGDDARLRRTEQAPIHTAHSLHEALPAALAQGQPGEARSMQAVCEARPACGGVDMVVRAHAISARPVRSMAVAVGVGQGEAARGQRLRVWGERQSEYRGGTVTFTEPEPFERLPLRWELAYGGHDPVAVRRALAQLEAHNDAEQWRRSRAFFHDILPHTVPLAYARNPVGRGYVADAVPEALHGVALPRVELEHDLLTPARFAQGRPLQWHDRPVPGALDYMDARMFPRTAMLGLPPLGCKPGDGAADIVWPEVAWGQVPAGFCRGNLLAAEPADAPGVVHPEAGRCAPMGLRLPPLRGDEPLRLVGLLSGWADCGFRLPGERPRLQVPGVGQLAPTLVQVFIDTEARRVELLWAARWPAERALYPGEDLALLARVQTGVEVLT